MLSIDYFNLLSKIDNLFCKTTYIKSSNIKSSNIKSSNIKLLYKKIDNINEEYIITIYSDDNIEVTTPIKNSNFKYKTRLDNIQKIYNYLLFHLYYY